MFEKMLHSVSGVKNYLSFFLTLISIVGVLLLAWFKGIELDLLLPSLLGLYITGRTVEKSSAHWSASKDSAANTEKVIEMVSGK